MKVSVNFVCTMLALDILMRRERLSFDASNMLHVYNVVCSRKEPDTNLHTELSRLDKLGSFHYVCENELRNARELA